MQTKQMTREQLMDRIDVLNGQIKALKSSAVLHEKMLATLKESEEQYRMFFNTSPSGLNIANLDGDILNANTAMLDLLGYTLEEYRAIHASKLYVDPNGRQEFLKLLHASNRVRDFEADFMTKNGRILPVLINSDYVDLDRRKVLLTSIKDVSHLKRIQKELKESEAQFRLLFNSAPVGILVSDYSGNLLASNEAIKELLGYSAEDLKSIKTIDFYYDPDDREHLLSIIRKTGSAHEFETKFKRKDGTAISVLLNLDLIDYKGRHDVLLTSIRDVTIRKQTTENLKKQRDFTDAILDTTASLMLVLDRQGLIIRFNRACEAATGYSFQEVQDKHLRDLLSANPEITVKIFNSLLAGNYPSTHENLWIAKNGAELLISWANTVLLDAEGKVEYIIATGIDITERKKAEIALQKANQELAGWVSQLKERTAEMSLLSEMGDQLQSCQSIEEACAISAQYIQKICPDSQGAIYLISPSKDLAEAFEMWGDSNPSGKMFAPSDCWANRRGRMHLIDGSHPGLLCGHISGRKDGQYLCVPMTVNGETIGILHLNNIDPDRVKKKPDNELYSEHKMQLVTALAEHIALSLSNLKLQETMRQQSIRDPLTGFYNRRFMEESLKRELLLAQREKTSVGLIMFDIDHFKEINDLYGHDGGDILLRDLGVLFLKRTRGEDIVCRYGGDEFVIVFPKASLENTRLRAEELRLAVDELRVYHMGTLMSKCTLSLGVAAFPEHGRTADDLLKSADIALYRAKKRGAG